MAIDTDFNKEHKEYENVVKQLLTTIETALSTQHKVFVAFVRNNIKYVLDIQSIVVSTNLEDAKITATGLIWKGGFYSIDGIDCGDGYSAAGYNTGSLLTALPYENNFGIWQDEIGHSNYFALYSLDNQLTVNNFVHTSSVNFNDDILEFSFIDQNTYKGILHAVRSCVHNGIFSVI